MSKKPAGKRKAERAREKEGSGARKQVTKNKPDEEPSEGRVLRGEIKRNGEGIWQHGKSESQRSQPPRQQPVQIYGLTY